MPAGGVRKLLWSPGAMNSIPPGDHIQPCTGLRFERLCFEMVAKYRLHSKTQSFVTTLPYNPTYPIIPHVPNLPVPPAGGVVGRVGHNMGYMGYMAMS